MSSLFSVQHTMMPIAIFCYATPHDHNEDLDPTDIRLFCHDCAEIGREHATDLLSQGWWAVEELIEPIELPADSLCSNCQLPLDQ